MHGTIKLFVRGLFSVCKHMFMYFTCQVIMLIYASIFHTFLWNTAILYSIASMSIDLSKVEKATHFCTNSLLSITLFFILSKKKTKNLCIIIFCSTIFHLSCMLGLCLRKTWWFYQQCPRCNNLGIQSLTSVKVGC